MCIRIQSDRNKAPKEIQDQIRARVLKLKDVVDSIHAYKPSIDKEEITFSLLRNGFIDPMEYTLTEIGIISGTSISTLWKIQNEAMEKLSAEHEEILSRVSDYVDI